MYQIIIQPIVHEDITKIVDYIFEKTYNKIFARNISYQIYGVIFSLNIFPYRFQLKYWDIRTISFKSYIIFYEIKEDRREVVIYRVLSKYQNSLNIWQNTKKSV